MRIFVDSDAQKRAMMFPFAGKSVSSPTFPELSTEKCEQNVEFTPDFLYFFG